MGHIYTARMPSVAVSTAQDLFQLLASSTVPIIIYEVQIGQQSDAGDAQAEMLPILLSRSTMAIDGSGGSAVTPAKHSPGSSAAVTVVEINNTTVSTVTTEIFAIPFNVQTGYIYLPVPEARVTILPTEGFIVELPAVPDDAITMSGFVTFEEIK